MWGLDYTTLKVGDDVAVARTGSWDTHCEGTYTVTKTNKMKIVVQRKSDGYERVFSVKRRCELSATSRYHSAFLESVEDQQTRQAKKAAERELRNTWKLAENAATNKDLATLRQLVDKLAEIVV